MKNREVLNLQLFAGTHTPQERYSKLVLAKLRKTAIFIDLFNRKYEGGDLSTSSTTYKPLLIDKDKYVNELVDGYDAASVPDNLVADRLDSAGYSMGISLDSELITLLTTNGTASKDTTELTKDTIYNSTRHSVY